jgi:hypothetical protein
MFTQGGYILDCEQKVVVWGGNHDSIPVGVCSTRDAESIAAAPADIAALLAHANTLAAENARLREAARKAGAALLMAHAARTKDEQQMTAEAREYVLFTVYPAAGIDCTGEVWDKESANG